VYLACACLAGVKDAITVFEQTCIAPARAHAARRFRDDSLADELAQIVRHRLVVGERKLGQYAGRGPLSAWVRIAMVRAGQNLKRSPRARETSLSAGDERVLDSHPEAKLVNAHERFLANEALRGALHELAREDRVLLRMHYLDEVTLEGVAKILGVSRATAARRLAAARDQLVANMRRWLHEERGISTTQVDSLIGALAGQIDVSLRRELATLSSRRDP
jgi:RNA polymerase sigma-70 factor, ECF subfamily